MPSDKPMPEQSTPIIIKGGNKKSSIPIRLEPNSTFEVTQSYQSQPNDWVQSGSDFSVSYIESLNIGSLSNNPQYCQTSSMAHPLTYAFKDDEDKNIFIITEVADGNNYTLEISVQYPNSYFQITEAASGTGKWLESDFNSSLDAEVAAVEVTDADNVPVCRISRTDDSEIIMNLEPPV